MSAAGTASYPYYVGNGSMFLKNYVATGETDAAKVLDAVDFAVSRILQRRQQIDAAGEPNRCLYVVAGELHDRPAHSMHHAGVVHALNLRTDGVACAMEQSHDVLMKAFARAAGGAITPGLAAMAKDDYAIGAMSLRTVAGKEPSRMAPVSNLVFNRLLADNRIPTVMTDAVGLPGFEKPENYERDVTRMSASSMHYGGDLDARDPSTYASHLACGVDPVRGADIIQPDGMNVRNHHMATAARTFAERSGTKIVFQICGNAHVMGNAHPKQVNFDGASSLSAHFRRQGCATMAMPLNHDAFGPVPTDHCLPMEDVVAICGLPDARTFLDATFAQEAAYIKPMAQGLGLDRYWMTERQAEAYMRQCRVDIHAALALSQL